MFKNVASQKVSLFAFTIATGAAKTGDAANITAYVSKDHATVTVLGDTSATEMDATNAPGWYLFDLTQAETNADELLFTAKSATGGVSVVGRPISTTPPNFTTSVPTAAENATAVWANGTRTLTALDEDTTTLDLDATIRGAVGLASANLDTQIDALPTAAENTTAVWAAGTRTLTGIDEDTTTLDLDATIRAAVGLGSANLDTQLGDLPTNAELATALAAADDAVLAAVATVDTVVDAIKVTTDKLDDTLEDSGGGAWIFTVAALAQAPSGTGASAQSIVEAMFQNDSGETAASAVAGSAVYEIVNNVGGGSADWTADERTVIRAVLGIPGSGTTPADPTTGILDTIRDSVGTRASQSSVDDLPTNAELNTALGTADDAVLAAIADVPTAVENADALLNRDMSAVSDTNARSPLNALRFLRNKWSLAGGTLTVTKENDSTTAWTAAVSTDAAADPVTGSDPA